jgi:hypothetical protein
MQMFTQTFVSYWKNYWRKGNLAMWFAILSMLLGVQFFLVWQGIYRALLYIALYYKPIRPFLIQWLGLPPTMLETPIPKFTLWLLVSTLMRALVVFIYMGAGVYLFTQVGFWGLNLFYILYQTFS